MAVAEVRGRVSDWIDKLLTTGQVELRPAQGLKAIAGLRRAVHQTATQLLAALEYKEELETNLDLAEARADEHRAEAEALAKQTAREARATELSVWLKHTWTFHGHGQNIGMQTLRARGGSAASGSMVGAAESLIKRDELLPRGLTVTFELAVDYRLMDRASHPNGDEFIGLWKWLTESDQKLVGVDRVALDLAG